jgi:Acetylornithine deacetylase/Succinyl-diaminopimelate desuccinylase and related deacylases
MPELGINAIENMIKMICNLDFTSLNKNTHPYLGSFTHSLNTIRAGIKTNVIPDCCEATLDMRTLPSQDHLQITAACSRSLNRLIEKDPRIAYKMETIIDKPGIEVDTTNPLVTHVIDMIKREAKESRLIGLNYFTDGAVLVPRLQIPFLICGPGDVNQAHKDNERISISQLHLSCGIYQQLTKTLVID